jgi:hypothetical protein
MSSSAVTESKPEVIVVKKAEPGAPRWREWNSSDFAKALAWSP